MPAQTTYYVSSLNGNDGNDGRSPATAWRTIDEVNRQLSSLRAGNKVLFERKGIYYGSIRISSIRGSDGNPITFGAYGEGEAPVISGAKQIVGWELIDRDKNLWRASVSVSHGRIDVLFVNGKKFYPARFPKRGYRYVTTRYSGGFQDNTLKFPDGHWNGATVAFKTVDWELYRDTVAFSYSDGRIDKFGRNSGNTPGSRWGYFFQNHINALDTIGEWVFNSRERTLTLCTKENPNDQLIEFMDARYGIEIDYTRSSGQNGYITIEDLCFQHYRSDAINASNNGKKLVIQRNIIRNCRTALYIGGLDDCLVSENTVFDIESRGFSFANIRNTRIHNNVIRRVAVSLDGGQSGWFGAGIVMTIAENRTPNDFCEITANRLDSIGYIGITACFAQNLLIKNNVVNYSMLTLSDGGGIYIGTTQDDPPLLRNNRIVDNIVLNTIGNSDGTPMRTNTHLWRHGIYLDDAISHITVQGNTVSNSGSGIFFHGSYNNIVRDNVLYGNTIAGITIQDINEKEAFLNNDVQNNFMYSSGGQIYNTTLRSFNNFIAHNKIDDNYISAPFSRIFADIPGAQFNRAQWISRTGFDVRSRSEPVSYAVSSAESPEEFAILAYNPTPKDSLILLDRNYLTFEGVVQGGVIHLQPYSSAILFRCKEVGDLLDAPTGETNLCVGGLATYQIPESLDLTGVEAIYWHVNQSATGVITPISETNGSTVTVEWLTSPSPAHLMYSVLMSDGASRISKPLMVHLDQSSGRPPTPIGPSSVGWGEPSSIFTVAASATTDEQGYQWFLTPTAGSFVLPENTSPVTVAWDHQYTGTVSVAYQTHGNCGWSEISDPLMVRIYKTNMLGEIPKIFTPNGDGFNDAWEIPEMSQYADANIRIYNRAKRLMVEFTGAQMPWDGRNRDGNLLESGYYLYQIELKNGGDVVSGYVTILR